MYKEIVDRADKTAYIITHNPALDETIKEEFHRLNIQWEEKRIGDYHVFYDLSGIVRLEEIGLGA